MRKGKICTDEDLGSLEFHKPVVVENLQCSGLFPVSMINTRTEGVLKEETVPFRFYAQRVIHHSGKSREECKAGSWHRNHGGQLLTCFLPLLLMWLPEHPGSTCLGTVLLPLPVVRSRLNVWEFHYFRLCSNYVARLHWKKKNTSLVISTDFEANKRQMGIDLKQAVKSTTTMFFSPPRKKL